MRREEDRVYLCNKCHWEKVPYRLWKVGCFTCLACLRDQPKLNTV
jgi:hypothetical protein